MKIAAALTVSAALTACIFIRAQAQQRDPLVNRGRAVVLAMHCNDCHTAGWRESNGRIPVSLWMTGGGTGYRGAWGTTYPINVRIWFQESTESEWLFAVRTRGGIPPMIWDRIRALPQTDQRAIYHFIHYLGPAGTPAPADLPAWRKPSTPYVTVTSSPLP